MSTNVHRVGVLVAKALAALLALAALAYVCMLGVLYLGQERLIFPATVLPGDYRFAFDRRFEEMQIAVPGASLNALYFTQPNPRGLVFFLHGNAGNLATWTTGVDFYDRVNYDLFIFDYRGYGKSTGHIESEAQLHADVRAAWQEIAPRYRDKPVVIYGRSLGSGLAAYLARDVDPALLVLVSPYANLGDAARHAYPIAPGWLLKYTLPTDAVIGAVKSPILLVHGSEDGVIPPSDSERLLSLTHSPARLLMVQGAAHNDIHKFPAYLDGLAAALIKVGGG